MINNNKGNSMKNESQRSKRVFFASLFIGLVIGNFAVYGTINATMIAIILVSMTTADYVARQLFKGN